MERLRCQRTALDQRLGLIRTGVARGVGVALAPVAIPAPPAAARFAGFTAAFGAGEIGTRVGIAAVQGRRGVDAGIGARLVASVFPCRPARIVRPAGVVRARCCRRLTGFARGAGVVTVTPTSAAAVAAAAALTLALQFAALCRIGARQGVDKGGLLRRYLPGFAIARRLRSTRIALAARAAAPVATRLATTLGTGFAALGSGGGAGMGVERRHGTCGLIADRSIGALGALGAATAAFASTFTTAFGATFGAALTATFGAAFAAFSVAPAAATPAAAFTALTAALAGLDGSGR